MDIFFVKNENDLDHIIGNTSLKRNVSVLVPLMPKAALAIINNGKTDVSLPIDFLNRDERNAIHDEAIYLSKTWYRNLKHSVEYKGIDLIDCCRLQMLGFFQDVLTAEILVPRIISEYKPKRGYFFRRPENPSFGNSMHDGSADVLEAVLQWEFHKCGIETIILHRSDSGRIDKKLKLVYHELRRRIPDSFVNIVKNATRANSASITDSMRLKLSDLPKDKSSLIGFGSGYDLLVIWPYLKAFAKEINGFPLLINRVKSLNISTLRSGLGLDEKINFLYSGDIAYVERELPNLRRSSQECIKALKSGDALPESLKNPLLYFQIEFLWNALIVEALDASLRAVSFFSKNNTALYLDDYCAGAANRAWTAAGNMAGVPTITVPHGAVNLVEFHDFNSKWALSWGKLGVDNWAVGSVGNHDHIIVSGDPSMAAIRCRFAENKDCCRNSVLLITGGFLHQAWTDMDLHGFLSTWEEIASIALRHPHIAFIIKPHPSVRDLGNWYRQNIVNKAIPNIKVVDDKKLEDLLSSSFLAVLVGKPGTAGLVSVLGGVPFIYLDTMLCRDIPGYNIWNDNNGVPRITNLTQLGEFINLIYSDSSERDKLLSINRLFSKKYLQTFQPDEVSNRLGLHG